MNFEEEMQREIKNKILKEIHKTEFCKIEYNSRKPLPEAFINKMWASIDWNSVIEDTKEEMHKRICNALIGSMETEIKTDVKNILSIDGVRQKLRVEIYPKIIEILDKL